MGRRRCHRGPGHGGVTARCERRRLAAAPRDERGAVTLFVSAVLVVLMLMAAFVVDLGMQRVARSDMQALADVVALDLARELDGERTAGELQATMEAAADDSVLRNSSIVDFDVADPPALVITLGVMDADGEFVTVQASEVPTAVRVQASASVGFAFAGVTGVEDGQASRRAIGAAESAACFQLGSYAATVKPAAAELFGDLMEQLVGQSTVGLVGYNGLATTRVTLLDLVNELNVDLGTVDGLLTTTVVLSDFYLAIATVLQREGKAAEAKVLEWAAASFIAEQPVLVGDLIALSSSSAAALETEFNVLDLLVGSAFLANGSNFLDLANLQAGNSSIGWTNTSFQIIEEPRRACDDDDAQTAQVRLNSTANLQLDNAPLLDKGPVSLRLRGADGKPDNRVVLALSIALAGAHGHLTDVDCGPPATFEADVWRDLITTSLTGSVTLGGSVEVELPVLVGTVKVQVPVKVVMTVSANASKPATTQPTHVTVSYPPQEYGDPVSAGIDRTVLPHVALDLVESTLEVGPVKVGGISIATDILTAAVNPLLQNVLPSLLTKFALANQVVDTVNGILVPLQTGMGLTLAGADFFGLPTPQCGTPRLVG